MLSVNGKISYDSSRADTMWPRRPELNVKEVMWHHVMESRTVKQERVTWGQRARGWRKMLLIKRSSKSEHRYRLVVRLKAIKYKEDYLCYLSSTSSLHSVVLPESFIIFLLVLMVRMCMMYQSTTSSRLQDALLLLAVTRMVVHGWSLLPLAVTRMVVHGWSWRLGLLLLAVTRMVVHGWSWRWRPEGSGQAASGQPSSLTTSLVAPPVVFFEAIEGTSPWSSSCCSVRGTSPRSSYHHRFPGLALILK